MLCKYTSLIHLKSMSKCITLVYNLCMIKTCVIGDIHGHYKQLIELLDLLEYNHNIDFESDRLIFLGDYVDGGPDTYQVIEQLIYFKKTYPHWIFLYGNHEDLLLDAYNPQHPIYHDYYLWYNQGGKATLDSYSREITSDPYEASLVGMSNAIPSEHLEFFLTLQAYYEDEKYFYVHGGINPGMTIEENKSSTSRYDMSWMREPFISSNYDWGKKIIFGHTCDYKGEYQKQGIPFCPIIRENKIGIDTFAHNTGRLTSVILPEETIVRTKMYD